MDDTAVDANTGQIARPRACAPSAARSGGATGGLLSDLAALAAHLCAAPSALITLADPDWEWLQSRHGPDVGPHSLVDQTHAHHCGALSVVSDCPLGPPQVVDGSDALQSHVCVRLMGSQGTVLGTLSLIGTALTELTDSQRTHLLTLATHVSRHIELHVHAARRVAEAEAAAESLAALEERQRILDAVLEHTDVLIYAKNPDGRFVLANSAVEHLPHAQGGLIGRTDHDLFATDVADVYRRNDLHILTSRERVVFSEDVIHADGSRHTYRSTKFPLIDDAGAVIGMGGISTDVTELTAARAAHQEAEHRWRILVEQAPIALAEINSQGLVTYANPRACALCGATNRAEIDGRSALDFVAPAEHHTAHALLQAALTGIISTTSRRVTLQQLDGTHVIAEIRATRVSYQGVASIQIELRDVTTAVAERSALEQVAATDYLTGTLNRRSWEARIPVLLDHAETCRSWVAIALIDLDHFKDYNDTHGHSAGDALLRDFTNAASTVLRDHDLFARWGGEEFILALPYDTSEQVSGILDGVRTCLPAGQTCSIGYTDWIPSETLADTISRADEALYRAKRHGRDQIARAEPPR